MPMSNRLITTGNLAIFEITPGANKPTFTLDNGVLWVEGYSIPFTPQGTPVRAMKRYELNLKGYTVIGGYDAARKTIQGDWEKILSENNIQHELACFMIKSNTIEPA